jgi:hypothetical protein
MTTELVQQPKDHKDDQNEGNEWQITKEHRRKQRQAEKKEVEHKVVIRQTGTHSKNHVWKIPEPRPQIQVKPQVVQEQAENAEIIKFTKPVPNKSKQIPCRFYFSRDGTVQHCVQGDNCFYSHEKFVFLKYYQLYECRTEQCPNLCRSYYCKECRARMEELIEPRECQGVNCKTMTKRRFCESCAKLNRQYMVTRNQ